VLNRANLVRGPTKTLIEQLAEYATYHDLISRQRAEDLLRQTEEELRQAKKMQAIGQLAGGLAHDLNNLLTAILGYSDLLLEETARDDPRRDSIEEIRKSGERAAAMTRQLLAFISKQILQPKVLDLNALIADMSNMLRRLLGDDIDLVTFLEATPSRIEADPVQIHQVVLNLAVNSRDAMPRGGTLTIRTANFDATEQPTPSAIGPRDYLLLAVSDTGVGMDVETRSHIFEPFFTTKGLGKGTGLGLATVYGIVQQGGGSIEVESDPGRGATFRIYLPVRQETAEVKRES
jgi:two-component system cell cycle sensor histidine kinase/response regulator CckA